MKKFSTTKATALSSAMTSGDTAVLLVDGSTYPDPAVGGNGPYTVLIGYGSDREEICTVTAKPSTNVLTVTRAEDGSAATAKNIGDVVVHGVSKRDWDDLLPKAGGTLTGALTLSGAPTADLHAATKKYADDAMPIGAIIAYGGTSAPTGWHLCNGTAHSSSALQALTGSANTPDLRGRFIVGAGSTYADKATGGAATVSLSTANMPSHSHGGVTGNGNTTHTHGVQYYVSLYVTNYNDGHTGGYYNLFTPTASGTTAGATAADGSVHTHTISVEGSGTAHENLPPYYALTYIIKKV